MKQLDMKGLKMKQLYGEPELMKWLESQGFTCTIDSLEDGRFNLCNWYAYKRSTLKAVRCECNSDKEGVQLCVKPYSFEVRDIESRSVTISITGEAGGVWWDIKAYSLNPDEIPEKFEAAERNLVAMWNAIER